MTQIEMDVARSTLRKNKVVAESLEKINWEQRRYEIAKAVIAVSYTNYTDPAFAAEEAVDLADALIKELKKKTEDGEV